MPCFSRMGLDDKGMPKVEVAFPDGTTDMMKLDMFRGRPGAFMGMFMLSGQEPSALAAS